MDSNIENLFTGIDTEKPVGTISGNIGTDFDPKYFAADLREFTSRGIKPKIVINSSGGSVFGGMEIIDAMAGTGVDTHIAGMAFSMAGIISQFGKKRTANDFAMLMLHAARGGDDKDLLEKVNDGLEKVLIDRTSLTEAQLTAIFKGKKNLFFNSAEMLKFGLIDEIVATKVEARHSQTELYAAEEDFFNHCVAQLEDNEENNKSNIIKMENEFKEVKAHLGLDSSDNERAILASIKAGDVKLVASEAKVETQKGEIEALKANITSMNDAKAAELVDTAVEAGKIKAEAKEALLKMAKADFTSAKNVIDNMTAAKAVPTSVTANMGGEVVASLENDAALLKMGYSELAVKHPEKLKVIAEEQPELFNQLIDESNKATK